MVVLEVFQVSDTRDNVFDMPVLLRRHEEITHHLIPANVR